MLLWSCNPDGRNRECLRINQDPLARQGRRVVYEGEAWPQPSLQVWARKLDGTDVAVRTNPSIATCTMKSLII